MNILKQIFFVLFFFPVVLMGADFVWIEEAFSGGQTGSWLAKDKNDKPVVVDGEMISSENHRVLSSDVILEDLAVMYADVMQVTFIDLTNASLIARMYLKFRDFSTGIRHRDRLCSAYVDKINKIRLQKNGDPTYIFTVSELQPNGEKMLLGSVMFDIKKHYEYGTVGLDSFVIKPEAQGRGLSKILASAILKLLPHTTRIILDVLYTNQIAQRAYESVGFTRYENAHEELDRISRIIQGYHFDYEYLTASNQKLQAIAAAFKDI